MSNGLDHRRKVGIGAVEVCGYISIGRSRVFGTSFDPYQNVKSPDVAMAKDALTIAQWFNANRKKWSVEELRRVSDAIQSIQFGPAYYYRALLQSNLGMLDYSACNSWAAREHEARGSVDVEANKELRDKVYKVLEYKGGLRKSPEPYTRMLDILHFAFCGVAYYSKDEKTWIDL